MSKIIFNRKASPIYAEYRPLYKIAQIILILEICSRSNKSSLIRLHLFNWAMKNKQRRECFLNMVKNNSINFDVWGIDPTLNYALDFSLAEKLIELEKGSYFLTTKGKLLYGKIKEIEELKKDIIFLGKIGKSVTDVMVEKITNQWN
jgi:hypothetical protein